MGTDVCWFLFCVCGIGYGIAPGMSVSASDSSLTWASVFTFASDTLSSDTPLTFVGISIIMHPWVLFLCIRGRKVTLHGAAYNGVPRQDDLQGEV